MCRLLCLGFLYRFIFEEVVFRLGLVRWIGLECEMSIGGVDAIGIILVDLSRRL